MPINSQQQLSLPSAWFSEVVRNIDNFAHNAASLVQRSEVPVPGMSSSQRVPAERMRLVSLLRHVTIGLIEAHGDLDEQIGTLPSLMLEAVDVIYTSDNHLQFAEFSFMTWLMERNYSVYSAVVSSSMSSSVLYAQAGLFDGSYYRERLAQQLSN